jgi:hypothetical protein
MVMILAADEILRKGLTLANFSRRRQAWSLLDSKSVERFKAFFGSHPVVYAAIWEDLQTTEIAEARIDDFKTNADQFLMAIHFLKCYPTEAQLAGLFQICEETARKWVWFYVKKIQALKRGKVRHTGLRGSRRGEIKSSVFLTYKSCFL